jgi:hypothetical protein
VSILYNKRTCGRFHPMAEVHAETMKIVGS